MEIRFGRAEPYWGYQDVSSPARPVVISRGSWRRWEAVLSLSRDDDSGHEPPASSRSPLRAFASREHYLRALAPWLKGVSQQSELHDKVADKCQEFVCHDPEYCGSLHGGWDGPNQMFLEDGVDSTGGDSISDKSPVISSVSHSREPRTEITNWAGRNRDRASTASIQYGHTAAPCS